jgi:hypothetical protein
MSVFSVQRKILVLPSGLINWFLDCLQQCAQGLDVGARQNANANASTVNLGDRAQGIALIVAKFWSEYYRHEWFWLNNLRRLFLPLLLRRTAALEVSALKYYFP